jgi:DNA-binding protein YbaB
MPVGSEGLEIGLRELETLTEAIDTDLTRLAAAQVEIARLTVEQEIPHVAGVVVVDGRGTLREVRIDPPSLKTTNHELLGSRIVAAIAAATESIERIRAEHRPRMEYLHHSKDSR